MCPELRSTSGGTLRTYTKRLFFKTKTMESLKMLPLASNVQMQDIPSVVHVKHVCVYYARLVHFLMLSRTSYYLPFGKRFNSCLWPGTLALQAKQNKSQRVEGFDEKIRAAPVIRISVIAKKSSSLIRQNKRDKWQDTQNFKKDVLKNCLLV